MRSEAEWGGLWAALLLLETAGTMVLDRSPAPAPGPGWPAHNGVGGGGWSPVLAEVLDAARM
jgi:hypothetical protein